MTKKTTQIVAGMWAAILLATLCASTPANSQAAAAEQKPAPQKMEPEQVQTFTLKNVSTGNDVNDLTTALRNNFPGARFFALVSDHTVTVRARDEDMRGIEKLVGELDRPKKSYRVTYTLAEVENGKRVSAQHFSLVVVASEKGEFKQGQRLPLIAGKSDTGSSQIQYIDVGMNIQSTVEAFTLDSKIEFSGLSDDKSSVGIQDPVIRQTMLKNIATFTPGKPLMIGSIDMPGSARHEEIEVLVEPLP